MSIAGCLSFRASSGRRTRRSLKIFEGHKMGALSCGCGGAMTMTNLAGVEQSVKRLDDTT